MFMIRTLKITALMLAVTVILSCTNAVSYAADGLSFTAQDIAGIKSLIDKCDEKGFNTAYEMLNYTVLELFLKYTAEDAASGESEKKQEYNNTYLNSLYDSTLSSLESYLSGTALPKPAGYRYKTGDYRLSENAIVNSCGKSFFSSGYLLAHDTYDDIPVFENMGMNNAQLEVYSSAFVDVNDGIPRWMYSKGLTGGDIELSSGSGYNGSTALRMSNPTEISPEVYMSLTQVIGVEPETNYEMSFYIRGNVTDGNPGRSVWCSAVNWDSRQYIDNITNDWQRITYKFTTGENVYQTTIRLNCDGRAELYLDNFSLKEEGGEERLLPNGDFETESSDAVYEIYPFNSSTAVLRSSLAKAEKHNIAVCLLLSPHYLNSFINTYVCPDAPTGYGLINYNVNDDTIKQLLSDYVSGVREALFDFDSIEGICLTNEPTFNSARNVSFYQPEYREFLRKKYGTIDILNESWGKNYRSFDSIPMPTAWAQTPAYYDWMIFNEKTFADWHSRFANIVRSCTEGTKVCGVPVYTKFMSGMEKNSIECMERGTDYQDFAEWEDLIGFDGGPYIDDGRIEYMQFIDMLNSDNDKPLYNIENHIIRDRDDNYSEEYAAHIYNSLWQAAIHGVDSSTIWVWGRTDDENDDLYGSILNRPDCLVSAGKATLDINRMPELVNAFAGRKKQAALYYSKTSNLYDRENNKPAVTAAYKELLMAGIRTAFVSEDNIDDIDSYDTLIIPKSRNTTQAALRKIAEFAQNPEKRIIFITEGSFEMNEYNMAADSELLEIICEAADTVSDVSKISEWFADMIYYRAVNADGAIEPEISVEAVEFNGNTYLNICNYGTEKKSIQIAYDGRRIENIYDMISYTPVEEIFDIKPLECKLLMIQEEYLPADEINLITSHIKENAEQINISWINPDYEISDIEVIGDNGLGIIATAEGLDKESGAANCVVQQGLSEETLYTFTVKITDKSGNVRKYITTGCAKSINVERRAENSYKFVGSEWDWKYENRCKTAGIFIDAAEKHCGKSSLKIVMNNKNESDYIGIVGEAANSVALEPGTEYELSFWTKSELKDGGIYWHNDWTGQYNASRRNEWTRNCYRVYDIASEGEKGTYTYKIQQMDGSVRTITGAGSARLKVRLCAKGRGCAWIDDVTLYKLDENKKRTGKNLITNGGFEATVGSTADNVKAIGTNSSATISWTNPVLESGFDIGETGIVDEEGRKIYTGSINAGESNSYTVSGLTNGERYNYKIKTIINGVSEYIPVSVVPKDYTNKYTQTGNISRYTDNDYILQNWDANGWDSNLIEIDTRIFRSGNSSLRLGFKNTGWGWLRRFAGVQADTEKQYKISFFASGIIRTGRLFLGTTGDDVYLEVTDLNDDWKEYSAVVAGSEIEGMRIIQSGALSGDIWIDDLSVYEVDENNEQIGQNLIPEGGFDVPSGNILDLPGNGILTAGISDENGIKTVYAAFEDNRSVGIPIYNADNARLYAAAYREGTLVDVLYKNGAEGYVQLDTSDADECIIFVWDKMTPLVKRK